jgi:hypothetical protein
LSITWKNNFQDYFRNQQQAVEIKSFTLGDAT